MLTEVIRARGHENVTATHGSTYELTSDDFLTPAGDCILGIEADRVPTDFDDVFVSACQQADATIVTTLEVGDAAHRFEGRGDPRLTFENSRSLVGRTSDYVDDRTIAVESDGAARDVDRAIVAELAAGAELVVTLSVQP